MISVRTMALLSTALQSSPHVMAFAMFGKPKSKAEAMAALQDRLGL